MRGGSASAPPLLLAASALLLFLGCTSALSDRRREPSFSASDQLAELLGQVQTDDDGEPENIGYGFQRARVGTSASPALSRDTIGRIIDEYIKEAAAEDRASARERPVANVFRERQNNRRIHYGRPRVTASLVEPQRAPSDPDEPADKPSSNEIDGRVAAALQDLWSSLPEDRSPTVVDELSDQDAALLLEELGRESSDNKRATGAWSGYPDEYQSARFPGQQSLRSDHRIGRRWLPRQDALVPEHQPMQHYRRSVVGSIPSGYSRVASEFKASSGRQRLSKRSPLRFTTEDKVRDDLKRIFAASDSESEKGAPAETVTGVTSTTTAPTTSEPATFSTPLPAATTTPQQPSSPHAPMAPSGDNNGTVHNHKHEHTQHAPPMLSAEGKQEYTREPPNKRKPQSQNTGNEEEEGTPIEEPRALELRLHKKSIRWSDYFGIDRRRRRTPPESVVAADLDEDDGGLLQRYLQVLFAQADQDGDLGQPRSLEKRVAVKKDAADILAEEAARCPAVAPLVNDCSRIVAEFDELLPLCALHRACHLCGSIIAAWPGSCDAALRTRSAEVCGANSACMGRAARLAARISAPGGDACTRHPCLADFLVSDADTDDDPDAAATAFGRLGSINNNNSRR